MHGIQTLSVSSGAQALKNAFLNVQDIAMIFDEKNVRDFATRFG